jgi:hypothetical protein
MRMKFLTRKDSLFSPVLSIKNPFSDVDATVLGDTMANGDGASTAKLIIREGNWVDVSMLLELHDAFPRMSATSVRTGCCIDST